MTDHPITPPPELVQQWSAVIYEQTANDEERDLHIATQAARWGADQELEACCEWLRRSLPGYDQTHAELRTVRRPKPPIPNEIKLTSGNETIRVTTGGFFYNEQHIEDGGEAHYLLVEFLKRAMLDVAWRHADD